MAHNAESYHPVPAIRRAREKFPIEHGGKDESAAHGKVKRTEVEDHGDGTAHVIAHHADGHVAKHDHASVAEAHEHAGNLMSGGEANAEGEQAEAECPECGGKMEAGKCTQCGYESPEEKKESPEFEAGEQEGSTEY